MRTVRKGNGHLNTSGFSLAEVIMALALAGMTMVGIISSYTMSAQHAEWSAYNLAAESLAQQGIEQFRSARWDPSAEILVDDLGISYAGFVSTNFSRTETIDLPQSGSAVFATNYFSISQISTNPPLRRITVECVWQFLGTKFFTNSVTTYRAPDTGLDED